MSLIACREQRAPMMTDRSLGNADTTLDELVERIPTSAIYRHLELLNNEHHGLPENYCTE